MTSWKDLLSEGRAPRFALICLGVWLTAADALVTATIMPSVGADLGGYGYFGWAVAGFMLGAGMSPSSVFYVIAMPMALSCISLVAFNRLKSLGDPAA
jgi:hypothetical protein